MWDSIFRGYIRNRSIRVSKGEIQALLFDVELDGCPTIQHPLRKHFVLRTLTAICRD